MRGKKRVTLNWDACHVERRPFCFPVRGCASAQREKKAKKKITKKRVIIINKRTSQFLRTLAILRHDHKKKMIKWQIMNKGEKWNSTRVNVRGSGLIVKYS